VSDLTGRLSAALADRYRIERELGAGGMATVYLAADVKHDRKVAVKVLQPELAAVIGSSPRSVRPPPCSIRISLASSTQGAWAGSRTT
jgi:serine/threonine protein kinase